MITSTDVIKLLFYLLECNELGYSNFLLCVSVHVLVVQGHPVLPIDQLFRAFCLFYICHEAQYRPTEQKQSTFLVGQSIVHLI
jgi:hypothetical protein